MTIRTTIHESELYPTVESRATSMLNFLRRISDRGRKELYLSVDNYEYSIMLLLVATGNIIVKNRTLTHVTILVEKL